MRSFSVKEELLFAWTGTDPRFTNTLFIPLQDRQVVMVVNPDMLKGIALSHIYGMGPIKHVRMVYRNHLEFCIVTALMLEQVPNLHDEKVLDDIRFTAYLLFRHEPDFSQQEFNAILPTASN